MVLPVCEEFLIIKKLLRNVKLSYILDTKGLMLIFIEICVKIKVASL